MHENPRMRILLADDERALRTYVAQGLREAGYAVDEAADGLEAVEAAYCVAYDAVILDIMMPRMSGWDVFRRLRTERRCLAPILFLTARDGIDDRVRGLDLGADDYLVKPFAFRELLARVRVLLRRGTSPAPDIQVGDIVLQPDQHRVLQAGRDVHLSPREFAILEFLMRNRDRVVSRAALTEHIWDASLVAESNFIDVFIFSIRRKLGASSHAGIIETVRGVGYRVASPKRDA